MVSRRFRVQASVALSRVPGSYLYHIVPSHDSLAILTSSDEVAIVDQNTLQASSTLSGVPQGSTCLAGGPILACSGRDGSIALFDSRSQESFLRLKSGKSIRTRCHPRSFPPCLVFDKDMQLTAVGAISQTAAEPLLLLLLMLQELFVALNLLNHKQSFMSGKVF